MTPSGTSRPGAARPWSTWRARPCPGWWRSHERVQGPGKSPGASGEHRLVATTAAKLPLIAGNWKMNCNHFEAIALVQKLAFTLQPKDYQHAEVVVLPPFTDLRSVQTLVLGDKLKIRHGAQDISRHDKGAYTGEVSGSMLAKLGCSYALCGHSERRQYHHEDDALVAAKVRAALAVGITPILCVGEPLEVRKAATHVAHVLSQLTGSLAKVHGEAVESMVIAYEPVW